MAAPCPSGKLRHDSQAAARRFIAGLPRGLSHDRQRAYSCDRCSGWHVSTQPTNRVAARRAGVVRSRPRRGPVAEPTGVATRAELDAWWAEHGGTP